MQTWTKKDEKAFAFIVEFEKEHMFPPTIREICEGVGVRSSSSVYNRLRKLESFGKIRIDENGRITIVGYEVVEKKKPQNEDIRSQKLVVEFQQPII